MCDTGCDTNRNTDIDEKNIAFTPWFWRVWPFLLRAAHSFKIYLINFIVKKDGNILAMWRKWERYFSSSHKRRTKLTNLCPHEESNIRPLDSALKFSNQLSSGWLCWLKMKSYISVITTYDAQIISMSIIGFLLL